jgi:hypothetical protein
VVEAFEYAKALTIRDTALAAKTPQHPSFRLNLRGRQDLRLSNLDSGESWLNLDQKQGPLEVVHLASGLVLIELQAGERTLRVAVPPGRYIVRRQQSGQVRAKQYDVAAGDVTRVAEHDLELSGLDRMSSKGTAAQPWQIDYLMLGGSGVHRGLGQAFSETALGRWAPGDSPVLGYAALGIRNKGLGLEVSVPGRIAWRLGSLESIEWIPWVGLPYYFVPNTEGENTLWAPFGGGLDSWLRLGSEARLGFNLGVSLLPQKSSTARAWAALGTTLHPSDRWELNLGIGYAQNAWSSGEGSIESPLAAVADARLALGSLMTDGILSRPLVGFRVSDALSVGLGAQVDQPLGEGRMGYEVTLGWTWRFGR